MLDKLTTGIFGFLILVAMCILSQCRSYEDDIIISIQEKSLLDHFRNKVIERLPHDYMKKDIYLIKWLRSQDFKVEAAERLLMEHLEWRKADQIDTIHEEDWSDMSQLMTYSLEGRDKIGRPILYLDIYDLDIRGAVIRGKLDRLSRYFYKIVDESNALIRKLGSEHKNLTRGQMIINIEGFNLIQHACVRCMPFVLKILTFSETHYPEGADQVIVLNAPAAVEVIVNVVRPLLNRDTREGLRIYGSNMKVWKAAMSDVFDFDQLPPTIGGTMVYKGMENHF